MCVSPTACFVSTAAAAIACCRIGERGGAERPAVGCKYAPGMISDLGGDPILNVPSEDPVSSSSSVQSAGAGIESGPDSRARLSAPARSAHEVERERDGDENPVIRFKLEVTFPGTTPVVDPKSIDGMVEADKSRRAPVRAVDPREFIADDGFD